MKVVKWSCVALMIWSFLAVITHYSRRSARHSNAISSSVLIGKCGYLTNKKDSDTLADDEKQLTISEMMFN